MIFLTLFNVAKYGVISRCLIIFMCIHAMAPLIYSIYTKQRVMTSVFFGNDIDFGQI